VGLLGLLLFGLLWWAWPARAPEGVLREDPGSSGVTRQPVPAPVPAPVPDVRAPDVPAPPGLPFEVEPGDLVQSEAELRLNQIAVRYRAHLAHLEMTPDRVVETHRLPQLLSEHHALVRELSAVAELAEPAHTQQALTQGAELDRAFAAWLEATTETASEPALVRELEALADQYYASAERGFALARELAAP
jgi:hypothetical protein